MKKIVFVCHFLLVSCGASYKSDGKKPLFEVLTQQSDGGATLISTRF
jgi:hypothetical protein